MDPQNPPEGKIETQSQIDFVSWHFSQELPQFIQSRPAKILEIIKFVNISALLKNLLSPYRRLVAKPKTSISERLSFELTSRFVGFSVRLTLIIAGIFIICAFFIYEIIASAIYIIPIFSFSKYSRFQKNTFFEEDFQNKDKFAAKVKRTPLVKNLSLFFEKDFQNLLDIIPSPQSAGIPKSQNPAVIMLALLKNWPDLTNYLAAKTIKNSQFELLVNYLDFHLKTRPKNHARPIGQSLSFGYTNTLDRFSLDITGQTLPSYYFKKDTITQIEKTILRIENNNVLLVGEPGVGRHATIEALASEIVNGRLPNLEHRRVVNIDTIALTGLSSNMVQVRGDFESVLKEAKNAGNIILVIDQIDKISASGGGRIDLSEVLEKNLTDNSLPIIGITTNEDFTQYIRPNSNLMKLFEKIELEETSADETTTILVGEILKSYPQTGISALFSAISEIVQKSSRLMPQRQQPEKSIIILEDAVAQAKQQKLALIDTALVDQILSEQTKTPVGTITKSEAGKLKDLETLLHQRIVGQDEAIIQIAKAMRRSRAELESGTKPIGSFLFLGPTGVGKTETAKALAQAYFGDENRMVRLDMSEFQDQSSLSRLIGNANQKTQGILTTQIRDHPFGLLLTDEFEKASREVHNLFLQILDEGYLTDAFGRKVSFDNIIIIATSNAGAEYIRELQQRSLLDKGDSLTNLTKKLVDFVLKKGLFTPELINRFDAAVVYQPLNQEQVVQISRLVLNQLAAKLKESKNISVEITDELCILIAQKGFDPVFGARPIRRLIADKIEDEIAKMIIEGTAKNGSIIPASALLKFVA